MKNHAFFTSFQKLTLRFPRLKRWEESIENSQDTLRVLSSKKVVLEGFIFATPAEILQAVSVFFAFHAVDIKIGFVTSTQIFYTGLVSGILSFIPGGFGVTEASMLGLLIKYYNNDLALLATAIIFVRLVTLWYSTFLGLITAQIIMKYKGILKP
jgi:glycosyltransferase 2 family protein